MKAFNKSTLAIALLAAAGTASATNVVKFGAAGTDGAVANDGYVTSPKELAASANFNVVLEAADEVISLTTARAPSEGDKITFKFTNGGIPTSVTPKLMFVESVADGANTDVILQNLPSIRFDSEDDAGLYTELTFRLNDLGSVNVTENTVIYLTPNNTVEVNSDGDTAADELVSISAGITIAQPTGVKAGAATAVAVSVDYAQSGISDFEAGSQVLARAYDGITLTTPNAVAANVNFANQAMTLVAGGAVSSDGKTVTSGNIVLEEAAELPKGYDWDNDGEAETTATAIATTARDALVDFTKVSLDAVVKLSSCNGIDVSDDNADASVTLSNATTALEYDEDEACTWAGQIAPAADDESGDDADDFDSVTSAVSVNVTGEAALAANSVSMTYDLKYDGVTTGSGTAALQTWTTNVVTRSGSLFFPSLVAANSNTTFSVVRFDQTGQKEDTDIVINGAVYQIGSDEAAMTFENVYLSTLKAGTVSVVTGDTIIAALADTSNAPEDFGYSATNLEVSSDNNYYISVTMKPSTSAKGSFGSVESYQAASSGRTTIANDASL